MTSIKGRKSKVMTTVLGKIDLNEWRQNSNGVFGVWLQPRELVELSCLIGSVYEAVSVARFDVDTTHPVTANQVRELCRPLIASGKCNQLLVRLKAIP